MSPPEANISGACADCSLSPRLLLTVVGGGVNCCVILYCFQLNMNDRSDFEFLRQKW